MLHSNSHRLPALPEEVTSLLTPLSAVAGFSATAGGPKSGRADKLRTARFGGKAVSLAELWGAGLPVPPGYVIDTRTFAKHIADTLPKGHDVASLIQREGTSNGMDRAARARERLLTEPLPDPLKHAIDVIFHAFQDAAAWGFSVRSSATCEDTRGSSLAGLATTSLGASSPEDMIVGVQTVWASLFLPRTLAYLHRWGIRDVAMAVLLMPMVKARAAGVMFTEPPAGLEGPRWGRGERLVHATFGLGAPVVDGAGRVDTYRLSREGKVIEQVIADKPAELVVENGALVSKPLAKEHRADSSLSVANLDELARLSDQVAEEIGPALDLEFAVERRPDGSDRIMLLQARPITGGLFPEGGDESTIWSRANVGEALPGPATPLTWSVAKRFSEIGFRAAFAALGCRVPRSSVLIGNVYGRFYLNLSTFMSIAGQVPGLAPRAFLAQSGGVPDSAIKALEEQAAQISKRGFFLRAPFTLPRLATRQIGLSREVSAWEADAAREHKRLLELDLELLPDDGLAETLSRASRLLFSSGELMLSCASASLASHLAVTTALSKMLGARNRGGSKEELQRDVERTSQALSSGIAELESASPGLLLLSVARLTRGEPEILELVTSGKARSLSDLPASRTLGGLLEFLEKHGDRAVREAELMTPRWREDHEALLDMLAATLRGPDLDPTTAQARARARADREMARLESILGTVEIAGIRGLVSLDQSYTRLRERMRAWVTRTLGAIRRVTLDIDRRLRRLDPSLEANAAFFCTYEELILALRSGSADIGRVTRLRRAEYQRDLARPEPPSTFTGRPPAVSLPPSSTPRLLGLAASPGVVEGRARVIEPHAKAASSLQPGEILVARTTDIGTSPLFLVAAGVVTELGGPLSHAAIVAREYNVPAVVNVEGATLSIHTGERLRVDGDRGVVERLDG